MNRSQGGEQEIIVTGIAYRDPDVLTPLQPALSGTVLDEHGVLIEQRLRQRSRLESAELAKKVVRLGVHHTQESELLEPALELRALLAQPRASIGILISVFAYDLKK